tara:strand:+ start:355 stop:666 length:312 start_codon:yes stop_codon:yes gene_type:complete
MYKILITTTDSIDLAGKVKDYVLINSLSPCVQILSNVESSYMWKNKIETAKEYILLIKCNKSNLPKIKNFIDEEHNYDIHELISADIDILNPKYRDWFDENSI